MEVIERLRAMVWRRGTVGARGERVAARHLRGAGYRVLARNLRRRAGEVDLLALAPDGRTIVVVEVKAGTGAGNPQPEVHVNYRKQRKLTLLACDLVRRYRLHDRPVRFDVIGVDLPAGGPAVVRHHVAAFPSLV